MLQMRIAQLLVLRVKTMVYEMKGKKRIISFFLVRKNILQSLCCYSIQISLQKKKINRALVISLNVPQNKKPKPYFWLSFKNTALVLLKTSDLLSLSEKIVAENEIISPMCTSIS